MWCVYEKSKGTAHLPEAAVLCDGVPCRWVRVSCLSPPDGFISITGFWFCTVLVGFQWYFGGSREKLIAFWLSVSCKAQERGSASSRCVGLSSSTASGVGKISDISLLLLIHGHRLSLCCRKKQISLMPTACPGNPGAWSAPLKPARLFINHPAVAQVLGTGPAPLVEVPFGAER